MRRRRRTYEPIFATSLATAIAVAEDRMPEGEIHRVCDRLEKLRGGQLKLWLSNTPSAQRPEVTEELLHRCSGHPLALKPAEVLDQAKLTLTVAEASLEVSQVAPLGQDLIADALGWVANALRLTERYPDAEAAWRLAFTRLRAGSADPLRRASLLARRSSLFIDLGYYEQARADLTAADRLFTSLDETHQAARVRLKLGRTEVYAGSPARGYRAYMDALRDLDPDRDPLLRLAAMEGSLLALTDLGSTWLALGLSDSAEPFFEELAAAPVLRLFRWLRGRLLGINGYLHEARTYLESVRLELIEAGQLVDASVCALDLASVYAGLRKPDTQRALAEEMLPIFNSAGLEREALAAVLLYVDAARNYRASRELMKSVLAKIDPFRKPKPKGRIEGAGEG